MNEQVLEYLRLDSLLFLTIAELKKNSEIIGFQSGVATGMTLKPSSDALLLHQHRFVCRLADKDASRSPDAIDSRSLF